MRELFFLSHILSYSLQLYALTGISSRESSLRRFPAIHLAPKTITFNSLTQPSNQQSQDEVLFLQAFNASSSAYNIDIKVVLMPNVEAANTKRFESLWMKYLHEDLQLSATNTNESKDSSYRIAYGSNADALLRYLETYSIPSSLLLLINPCSLYTLGERHGRDYRYAWISQNIAAVDCKVYLVSTSASSAEDCKVIHDNLQMSKRSIERISLQSLEKIAIASLVQRIFDEINI